MSWSSLKTNSVTSFEPRKSKFSESQFLSIVVFKEMFDIHLLNSLFIPLIGVNNIIKNIK